MKGFEARDGMAVAELDDEERLVVARIVADVGLLLSGEPFGSEPEPAGLRTKSFVKHAYNLGKKPGVENAMGWGNNGRLAANSY